MSNGHEVGSLSGNVLIPTAMNFAPTASLYFPSPGGGYTIGQRWTHTLTGEADMDLTHQNFHETITKFGPIKTLGLFSIYPTCLDAGPVQKYGTFPDKDIDPNPPTDPIGCDPGHLTNGPNRFCDELSYVRVPVPVKGFFTQSTKQGIACAFQELQSWSINACTFPSPQSNALIRNTLTLSAPNVVTVSRDIQ